MSGPAPNVPECTCDREDDSWVGEPVDMPLCPYHEKRLRHLSWESLACLVIDYEAALAALSSPETTPAPDAGLDAPTERELRDQAHAIGYREGYRAALAATPPAAEDAGTPAGVLDEAALAFMEHVQAQGCDHAESKAGSHTGCPQVLALAAALGRSGSGGGRG